ncbi:hypothetical protein BHE74_00055730 [Ensete ventricosum]|nr:hypothetical protein BHE74_00055730 [Ensete ventricosum]RZR84566.1 hypothetical protein BHM03_00011419 [Ensete ventricosum]
MWGTSEISSATRGDGSGGTGRGGGTVDIGSPRRRADRDVRASGSGRRTPKGGAEPLRRRRKARREEEGRWGRQAAWLQYMGDGGNDGEDGEEDERKRGRTSS